MRNRLSKVEGVFVTKFNLFLVVFLSASMALAMKLDPEKGSSEFLAIGRPAAIKIWGKAKGPSGDLQIQKDEKEIVINGEAVIDMDTFDTGIAMRDQHMKEKYLETGKAKNAILKIENLKLPRAIFTKGGEMKFPAKLQLHGVEKPVEVVMNISSKDGALVSVSKFKIKISDYEIQIPSFSGITVADSVDVTVQMPLLETDLK